MLTQDQKDQLELLTKHEKYGELLICAINTWETATPKQGYYLTPNKECCLIGAAAGESVLSPSRTVANSFELAIEEIWSISDGFENAHRHYSLDNCLVDSWNFGKAVADIVIEK